MGDKRGDRRKALLEYLGEAGTGAIEQLEPSVRTGIPVLPVILSGGAGTRLWPLSRAGYPKQFLVLTGDESLFQQAVRRLADLAAPGFSVSAPLIVGNESHRFLVLDQLRGFGVDPGAVLLEPVGRNTAPALTLAAFQAGVTGADPVLVVTSADQTVADPAAFTAALHQAVRGAAEGAIVILGVTPNRPEPGAGLVRTEEPVGGSQAGHSGPIVLKASVWLAALQAFRPDIAQACGTAWKARTLDGAFVRPGKAEFAAVPGESVERAVIERSRGSAFDIRAVPVGAGWNDLGTWDAVWRAADKDEAGNASVGDAWVRDSRNTLVHATSRVVSAVGLHDVVIVETPDAVLVTDRSHSQDVKQLVDELNGQQRGETALHRKVHRPWGWYDSVDSGPRHQVKRIMVKPGASLSLQMHHHRAEHWIVVSGTAEVTNGDRVLLLSDNQSTYIPLGQLHRLHNPGKVPLEIIEVQSGSYLGEDDIVRIEDTYGRN